MRLVGCLEVLRKGNELLAERALGVRILVGEGRLAGEPLVDLIKHSAGATRHWTHRGVRLVEEVLKERELRGAHARQVCLLRVSQAFSERGATSANGLSSSSVSTMPRSLHR